MTCKLDVKWKSFCGRQNKSCSHCKKYPAIDLSLQQAGFRSSNIRHHHSKTVRTRLKLQAITINAATRGKLKIYQIAVSSGASSRVAALVNYSRTCESTKESRLHALWETLRAQWVNPGFGAANSYRAMQVNEFVVKGSNARIQGGCTGLTETMQPMKKRRPESGAHF